jgi:hypothetical protein
MDKVDFSVASLLSNLGAPNQGAKKTRPGDGPKESRKTHFTDVMKKALNGADELGPIREYVPSEEALTELMDAVHSAGSDLLERPFHNEIIKYKKAVRNFIHYVVENGFKVQDVRGPKAKTGEVLWKEKIYKQIKVIDQKLEDLAVAILSGQANQLEKVSKVDEIRGLLVDLTVTGAIKERDG